MSYGYHMHSIFFLCIQKVFILKPLFKGGYKKTEVNSDTENKLRILRWNRGGRLSEKDERD